MYLLSMKKGVSSVDDFVFNFVLFSYRQRVLSKHLAFVLTYVLITNNQKLSTTFLTMKPLLWKIQILYTTILK